MVTQHRESVNQQSHYYIIRTCVNTFSGRDIYFGQSVNNSWHILAGDTHLLFSVSLLSVCCWRLLLSLQWRHNWHDSVSNHQPHDCLHDHIFRRSSKKISNLRVTGLCAGNSPGNSQHKWPVTRKMFPFDDVIMISDERYWRWPEDISEQVSW